MGLGEWGGGHAQLTRAWRLPGLGSSRPQPPPPRSRSPAALAVQPVTPCLPPYVQVDVSFDEYSLERAAEAGADVLFVATGFREGLYRRLRDEAEVPPRTHDEPCHAPSHAPAMSCYALASRLARAQPNPTIHDVACPTPHPPPSRPQPPP